jgi:XTP/dITP diphosphohydrolase
MNVVLATNNDHKRKELAAILTHHRVLIPSEIGIEFSFEETASTFLDNALGKARALQEMVGRAGTPVEDMVIVADDSGLCVDALGGEPGIYSARYGSPDGGKTELSSEERNALLLRKLTGVDNRAAYFVCCMVAVFSTDRYAAVEETFEGLIATAPSGSGGFGYDPVFYLPDRNLCVAELPDAEKNLISHRGKAAAGMAAVLDVMSRE